MIRQFTPSALVLIPLFALATSIVAAQSDLDHLTTDIAAPLSLELVAEATQSEVVAARARNDDHLKREVLYFAKRHRFVRMNDAELEKATRLTIQLFDDVSVTAEWREFQRAPGLNVWRGVVVDPVLSSKLLEYPSGKPMDEDAARELLEQQNSITIYAHIIPSIVTGSSTSRRSIQLGVRLAAMENATFVIESLKNDPLVHVVYELDEEKCCFATLDTPLDPERPSDARALEKGRAYKRYIDQLDAEEKNRIGQEVEQ